ncbi:hypothetical protein ABAYE3566 [Acinetobacter baumannii AYE]|nr:hypothetical protein ABAYE3566 [Acinetobacter baumannii AYE]
MRIALGELLQPIQRELLQERVPRLRQVVQRLGQRQRRRAAALNAPLK